MYDLFKIKYANDKLSYESYRNIFNTSFNILLACRQNHKRVTILSVDVKLVREWMGFAKTRKPIWQRTATSA